MTLPSRLGLHVKHCIISLLTTVMIAAAMLSGVYTLKRQQLRSEAETVAKQVASFRDWVAGTGVVWVDHLAKDFPDAMEKREAGDWVFHSKNPALAIRELSVLVSKSDAHATFRMTSDNYRNPKNLPDDFERQAIQALQADSGRKYAEAFESGMYRYAKPLIVTKDCLGCHGDPKDAPPEVLSKYGPDKGFGYKEGGVRGIISVKLPDVSCWEIMWNLVNPCSVILVLCAVALNILFTKHVLIRRLQQLTETTERIAKGDLELMPPVGERLRDEVDQVAHSIDLLRASLVVAMEHLRTKKRQPADV